MFKILFNFDRATLFLMYIPITLTHTYMFYGREDGREHKMKLKSNLSFYDSIGNKKANKNCIFTQRPYLHSLSWLCISCNQHVCKQTRGSL